MPLSLFYYIKKILNNKTRVEAKRYLLYLYYDGTPHSLGGTFIFTGFSTVRSKFPSCFLPDQCPLCLVSAQLLLMSAQQMGIEEGALLPARSTPRAFRVLSVLSK